MALRPFREFGYPLQLSLDSRELKLTQMPDSLITDPIADPWIEIDPQVLDEDLLSQRAWRHARYCDLPAWAGRMVGGPTR